MDYTEALAGASRNNRAEAAEFSQVLLQKEKLGQIEAVINPTTLLDAIAAAKLSRCYSYLMLRLIVSGRWSVVGRYGHINAMLLAIFCKFINYKVNLARLSIAAVTIAILLGFVGNGQKTMADISEKRTDYNAIDLKGIPTDKLTDIDPKIAAIKAFGSRESASPEGLISETIEVVYQTHNIAFVTMIVNGLSDDSVAASKYKIEMHLTGNQWKIVWAGSQFKCQLDRGHTNWSNKLCQ